MKALPIQFPILVLLCASFVIACDASAAQESEEHEEAHHRIVVTRPVAKDVISTKQYVSQIHSRRHIEIRALERGYLEEVHVKEGASVEQGAKMFRIMPILYQAKLDTESAEAEVAEINFRNTKNLADQSIVSQQELARSKAELAKAHSKVNLARAELQFTVVRAPFAGIVDRQHEQKGSLVEEGDILTTLSDNHVMWVYFNVPEAGYLQYRAGLNDDQDGLTIELQLANGDVFPHPGKIGAIEADFNNQTGNIAFRADFPNPDGLLRHGQTGTLLIHRTLHDAIVIPQRATYEILAKKYVYVIEPVGTPSTAQEEHPSAEAHAEKPHATHGAGRGVVRQREIVVQEELDDVFVIKEGLGVHDRIVFEGIRQVRDGDVIEYEEKPPKEILEHLKFHAE